MCSHKIYIKNERSIQKVKKYVIFANFRYNRSIKYKGVPYENRYRNCSKH